MSASAAPAGTTEHKVAGRLEGLDLARALAFVGMLLAHVAVSFHAGDPGWLQAIDQAADGRAAPLYAVLLGVGAGILSARTADNVVVRRGLVLLLLGMAIWPLIDEVHLILPHYGVLLAVVPLARRLPDRWLLVGAAAAFLPPSVITAIVEDHGLRGASLIDSYGDLLDWREVVARLVWTGAYPLVGWLGFVLVGLWISRQRLADRSTQVRLLVLGAAVAALQPLASAVFSALDGSPASPVAAGWAAFFDGTAHSNRTAWYVLASGSAVAVIAFCLRFAPGVRTAFRPLRRLGQLALTAYLAHLVLLELSLLDWRDTTEPSLATLVGIVVLVVIVFAALADWWTTRWRRGPAETIVRRLAS